MNIINDLKTMRFWRYFIINSLACVGFISAAMQFLSMVTSKTFSETFQSHYFILVISVLSVAYGLFRAWPRPIEEEYSQPRTRIKIVKGDILDQDAHIVIGVCDTFDTQTPNIIARNSLQGQLLERIFNNDLAKLDKLIDEKLSNMESISSIEKPGRKKKYEIGSIITIEHMPKNLYLLAYCAMNEHNEAHGTVDAVWKSLVKLWEGVSRSANGDPVAIPVIGGGQARMSNILPAQDSIRLIIMSYIFSSRYKKICDELRIVVRASDYEKLDRMELQSFLSSLRKS
ncbi:macro domain-containing protein [Salmonella enterica subsp. enterica]|nr:hypothetical protein [Salmonella enterica subsp. enterica serovar Wien str. CFSAN000657]EDS1375492.1 hypothetical protein [Salmonella enterica]EDT2636397.1 hypothetical protein [Salmonella enterica subsp. enterica]EED8562016.1 hypothetical protein [Salmonella enterica subsp. enterica serovar Agoueve]EEE6744666.1 hypothetical protein [Salmonella enterica subsp. enterica serovar Westhampton]HAU7008136.1 hypothetical protein [Salmonella enterica subsp. enterica serovar Berta]